MAPSVRPDPVSDYLAALHPASDPVSDYLSSLPAKAHDYHAEFKSGALQKRMQGANARDMASAQEEDDAQPGYLERLGTHMLEAGQGIPGGELVEAKAGQLGSQLTSHPMDYRQSLQTLRGITDQIGGKTKALERMMGSTALLPFLPRSAATSGAIIGGADQALNADPDMGLGMRAARTAGGAAVGAATGKAFETLVTGGRAFRTPLAEDNIAAQQAARTASGDKLYGQAIAEGQGRTATPEIRRVLQEPDNAHLMQVQQGFRQNAGLPQSDPTMLDNLYKARSDISGRLERGLDSPFPTRPNIGRGNLIDNRMAQQDLLSAMDGPMPTYRTAVNDQAQRFSNIDATREGQDFLRAAIRKTITPGRSLEETTPRALSDWAKLETTNAANKAHMAQGILGAVREDIGDHPLKSAIGGLVGKRGVGKAPDLLRRAQDPTQATLDLLAKLGLSAASTAATP